MAETVMFHVFHLFLVYSFQIQASSAVTDVFVKTGDDLILNLTEAEIPSNSRFWTWRFKDDVLVEFTRGSPPAVVNNRSGKVEVLEKSYRVKLKDLQKSHSGIYTANVVSPKLQTLTQYNVTVLDPVSPVNLTLNSTSSTSPCILIATCRTDDFSISVTLRCEDQTCNQEEGESRGDTKSGSSLHIYQLQESIICIHSNQVSRNDSKEKIEGYCPQHGESRKYYGLFALIPLGLLLLIVYILHHSCKKMVQEVVVLPVTSGLVVQTSGPSVSVLLSVGKTLHQPHLFLSVCHIVATMYLTTIRVFIAGNNGNFDNTIYALPERKDQTETSKETAEDEGCSPTTTYSTVGPSLSKGATNIRGNDQPESVYSLIKAV